MNKVPLEKLKHKKEDESRDRYAGKEIVPAARLDRAWCECIEGVPVAGAGMRWDLRSNPFCFLCWLLLCLSRAGFSGKETEAQLNTGCPPHLMEPGGLGTGGTVSVGRSGQGATDQQHFWEILSCEGYGDQAGSFNSRWRESQ